MAATQASEPATQEFNKLVLCFDGTGNTFSGSNADTNVVKILNKLDRNYPNQHHYYQTGIGTYDINDSSVNKGWFARKKSSISQTLDQGFGTTFDAHVMAGYRFLMRYYQSDAKIYIFGFSRGAMTARFLARMVYTVGLLCKGNEEMVPFAYGLYQRYLAGQIQNAQSTDPKRRNMSFAATNETQPLINGSQDTQTETEEDTRARDELTAFSRTFCRKENSGSNEDTGEGNIKVYFLGLWDCVNSVAVLELKASIPVPVKGTAHFVRHAVSVDERRVKFKAALLAQDVRDSALSDEDIKEVWFPGCHGDVGGGWPSVAGNALDSNKNMTLWQRFKSLWRSSKPEMPSKDVTTDPFQMSDIPLAWMIRELELVGRQNPAAALKWSNNVNGFKRGLQKHREQALRALMHDSLRLGHGTAIFKVIMWNVMEWIPLITRWELESKGWTNRRFPLNGGGTRDIPPDAVLHESLVWRLRNDMKYRPRNNHGEDNPPCLKRKDCVGEFEPIMEAEGQADAHHRTYRFVKDGEHVRDGV